MRRYQNIINNAWTIDAKYFQREVVITINNNIEPDSPLSN